jgi:uncharacterized protein (DUF1810 family)
MDPFEHFVRAQDLVYDRVVTELTAGRKRSHWMWFIFPQLVGLGLSDMSVRFAIASLADAEAYLRHPLLGPRLRQCTELVNAVEGRSALEIFGSPDDMKLRSSMTLFARATPDNGEFVALLAKYYYGLGDPLTLELLGPDHG